MKEIALIKHVEGCFFIPVHDKQAVYRLIFAFVSNQVKINVILLCYITARVLQPVSSLLFMRLSNLDFQVCDVLAARNGFWLHKCLFESVFDFYKFSEKASEPYSKRLRDLRKHPLNLNSV